MAEEKESPRSSDETQASFAGLIMTLALSALEQLDPVPSEPRPGMPAPDYRLAKPIIDTLEVLKEKTKGNLTKPEADLLDSLLLDLRVRFLKASNQPTESPKTPSRT